jgi:hypothetical protein
MKLAAGLSTPGPEPMTEQDVADWGGVIDARSNVSVPGRRTPDNVLNAGEAALAVINARRGKK